MSISRAPRTRSRAARAALLLGAAAFALAGCAAAPAPGPAPAPTPAQNDAPAAPSAEAVAWTESACGALAPVVAALANRPSINQNDLPGTRQAYLAYLDQAIAASDQALRALSAAGAPPVVDGQQLADRVRTELDRLRTDLTNARATLAGADPADPGSFGTAVAAAGNVLASMANSAQAVGTIVGNSQLRPAFQQAPACAPLR